MPYKRTLAGKTRITGKLEVAVGQLRAYHAADFPPGTLPLALPFENYLGAATGLLRQYCEQLWTSQAAKRELAVRQLTYDRIRMENPGWSVTERALYEVLDYIVENSPSGELAEYMTEVRQLVVEHKEELFI